MKYFFDTLGIKRVVFSFMSLLLLLILWTEALLGQTVLIDSGAVWKYLDDGSDQGEEWRAPGFDDSAWLSGPAQFGYGEGDESTLINFGPDSSKPFVTTYFRYTFDVADSTQHLSLILELLRDDAAVVFLNGSEILRSNLSLIHRVHYGTLCRNPVEGSDENIFLDSTFYPSNILQGTNLIAVEVHQSRSEPVIPDLSFDLRVLSSIDAPDLTRKEPYLIYNGTNTEMQILWQLTAPEICTIAWGTDSTYSVGSAQTEEYGDDNQHTYTINDLTPNTKYYYKVTINHENHTGSFRSAPEADATDLKFLAYGDTRSYPLDHNTVAKGMVDAYKADGDYQTIVAAVGDYVNNGNREDEWHEQFFDPALSNVREFMANLPLQGTRGNHEQLGILYQKYFPYQHVADFYWSFDYGPAHFVIIDQYVDYKLGSAQYQWIENDLASSKKPWKIIVLHEPGWTAAGEGGHGNASDVQDYIQPLCEQYGVTIVFGGHNHYYARAEVNGVQHLTIGGGGAPLRDVDPSQPNILITAVEHHFAKIKIENDLLTCEVVKPNGDLIESFTVDMVVSVESENNEQIVTDYILHPAYPNPFNPSTTISYSLPETAEIQLSIYNLLGQKVVELINQEMKAGTYSVDWNTKNVSSGNYIVTLKTNSKVLTEKVTLLK